jgi:hypothetical protein
MANASEYRTAALVLSLFLTQILLLLEVIIVAVVIKVDAFAPEPLG